MGKKIKVVGVKGQDIYNYYCGECENAHYCHNECTVECDGFKGALISLIDCGTDSEYNSEVKYLRDKWNEDYPYTLDIKNVFGHHWFYYDDLCYFDDMPYIVIEVDEDEVSIDFATNY